MRPIDADALLEKDLKVTVYGVTNLDVLKQIMTAVRTAINDAPTIEVIPVEWLRQRALFEWKAGNYNAAAYLNHTINDLCGLCKKQEQKAPERTCYNCKHGAFGFDSDLGCNLWHRGKLDAKSCQFWEGTVEVKEE